MEEIAVCIVCGQEFKGMLEILDAEFFFDKSLFFGFPPEGFHCTPCGIKKELPQWKAFLETEAWK